MDENLHHIDDLFKKGINEYEDTPSKNVWEQIDKGLDKRKVISISRKYNKLKWVAAALFLFSSAVAMYTISVRSKISKPEADSSSRSMNTHRGNGEGAVTGTSRQQAATGADTSSVAGSDASRAAGNEAPQVARSAGNGVDGQGTAGSNAGLSTPDKGYPANELADHNNRGASAGAGTSLKKDVAGRNNAAKADPNITTGNNSGTNKSNGMQEKIPGKESSDLARRDLKNANQYPATGKENTNATGGEDLKRDATEKNNLNNSAAISKPDLTSSKTGGRQNPSGHFNSEKGSNENTAGNLAMSGNDRIADKTGLSDGQSSVARPGNPEAKPLNPEGLAEQEKSKIATSVMPKYRAASFSRSSLPSLTAEQEKMAIRLQLPKDLIFTITPFYSFDAVKSRVSNNNFKFREEDHREIKDKEEIGQATTFGLAFQVALDDRWSLGTGIAKSSLTTTIKPKQIFARPDNMGKVNYRINCSAGYTVVNLKYSPAPGAGDSALALASKNTLEYMSVPLSLSYKIGKGKFTVSPGVGLTMNFLTKGSIQTEIARGGFKEKMSFDKIEGLNSAYLSGNFGVGIDYSINKNLSISLLPSTAIGMSSINSNTTIRTFLNKTSLGLGLSVHL